MPRPVPSDRDEQLIRLIRTYTDRHGYAPTYREMADNLGVALKTIRDSLDRLRDGGRVTWNEGQTRTLRILEER